jgi:biotin carboxylase
MTFLCISFYFKGEEFLRSCKREGNTVYLLTHRKLETKPWPRNSVDEFFYMDNDSNDPDNINNIVKGIAWLLREKKVDVIIALDDFDVEKAATIREEFRIPGMGQTTARYFRDKLAMRIRAHDAGIKVPAFSSLFYNDEINRFADTVSAPWVLKPRSEASATGIKKVYNKEELWHHIHQLGDRRHNFLIEQFKPGDVYHADALSYEGKMKFCWVSKYLATPFDVAHGAGIFRSATLETSDKNTKAIKKLNQDVMLAFGMKQSASHTEYIKSHDDGAFYFLETSSRVGGAHLAVLVEAATGINLWGEWAKIETAKAKGLPYSVKPLRNDFAGIIISLARFEQPDVSIFNAEEIYWRMNEKHHVGMVLKSENQERVMQLLSEYTEIIKSDFHASAPVPDKPTN